MPKIGRVNMMLWAHRRALALRFLVSPAALLACTLAGHTKGVDKRAIGSWELPMSGGRWLWKIDSAGTYKFHSEAPDGVASHLAPPCGLGPVPMRFHLRCRYVEDGRMVFVR